MGVPHLYGMMVRLGIGPALSEVARPNHAGGGRAVQARAAGGEWLPGDQHGWRLHLEQGTEQIASVRNVYGNDDRPSIAAPHQTGADGAVHDFLQRSSATASQHRATSIQKVAGTLGESGTRPAGRSHTHSRLSPRSRQDAMPLSVG